MLEFLLPLNVKPNNDHYIVSEPGQARSVNMASVKHIPSQLGQDLCFSKERNSSNSAKYVYFTTQLNQPNITYNQDNQNQSFQYSWYEHWTWLDWNDGMERVLCHPCRIMHILNQITF